MVYEEQASSPYLRLLGGILALGASNPDYFRDDCGRHWALIGGLEPSALWKQALEGTSLARSPYSPLGGCHPKAHREYRTLESWMMDRKTTGPKSLTEGADRQDVHILQGEHLEHLGPKAARG